ncbi:hypothetical protein GE21DRAFT_3388 [Neurospora crassa]|uniref:Uncharacterized protein n=2 Tax=Neurospora crassa TaxID=5141 RepID=Q1K559_NEUCR|nr:hypothetical protein NCU01610 [Neurospora crassa OR74A]EAA27285.3 hypothetical protein NCU01610 [Neurospora crassa OR74A]KHE87120.1 hypothetical protein GE21DRAFT_3388 [Neurospora crassa]CAB91365.2 hypothetical protein [Neurospora crassa]|eukprot:XP_956521.3 hypothetical protein NCU01610 [Neurospora crassa OR74A]
MGHRLGLDSSGAGPMPVQVPVVTPQTEWSRLGPMRPTRHDSSNSSRRPSPTNAVRSRTLPSPLTASACPSKIPTIPFQRPLGCDTLRRRRSSLASQRNKLACTSSRSSLLGPPRSSPPNVSLCNWNLAPSIPQSYRRKRLSYRHPLPCTTHSQVRNQGIFTIPPGQAKGSTTTTTSLSPRGVNDNPIPSPAHALILRKKGLMGFSLVWGTRVSMTKAADQ